MTKILLVEDEESFREGLSFMLSKEGYEVITADNGNDAVSKFEQNGADLVLLDVMLPGLSGLEVCKKLRTMTKVPIIMLTAKDTELDKVLGLAIVKHVCENHGGEVSVWSVPGQGSTFTMKFPQMEEESIIENSKEFSS